MCRSVEALREQGGEGGTMDPEIDWRYRLCKLCRCYAKNFGFCPGSIGEALKNFEQDSNVPTYIFGRLFWFILCMMRVEGLIKEITAER